MEGKKESNLRIDSKMNMILITGGSGFLGQHLVKKLLGKYKDVRIRTISRNENDIERMLTRCHSERLEPVIGDIRDISTLRYVLRGVDTVVHLAAMKHIDFCEMYPLEAITINVIGTMNLLKLFKGVTFVVMSTDKAVEAMGCYGASKLLMEKLVLEKARKEKSQKYMVIRSGNIFGSSGSVIEKWMHQIAESNEIIVTDLEMTRFFIDVNILSDFIINIIEQGETGNIYIPFQKAIKLENLAKAVIELNGGQNTRIKVTGLRKGEKLHERLFYAEKVITSLQDSCSQSAQKMTVEEIKQLFQALVR